MGPQNRPDHVEDVYKSGDADAESFGGIVNSFSMMNRQESAGTSLRPAILFSFVVQPSKADLFTRKLNRCGGGRLRGGAAGNTRPRSGHESASESACSRIGGVVRKRPMASSANPNMSESY